MRYLRKIAVSLCIVLGIQAYVYAFNLDNLRNYFLNGNYKACIIEGEKVLAQASSSKDLDELYYILGLSYLKEGNYLRASDIFEIIIKEYHNSRFKEEAKLGLGDSFFLKGDFKKAQSIYQEILKGNYRSKLKPAVYYRISQIGRKTADREKEQLYLAKLKSEFPQSPEALTDKEFLPGARFVPTPVVAGIPVKADKPVAVAKNDLPPPVSKPARPTEAVVSIVPPEPAGVDQELIAGTYSVQVGAFSSSENAKRLTLKLKAQGYSSYISLVESLNKTIYKVRVGGFLNLSEAKAAERKLKVHGYPTKIIP
jgi:cell division septation protein DedD